MAPNVTAKVLAKPGTGSTREENSEVFPRIARIERIRQSLALAEYEDVPAGELDEVVAPWFRGAVEIWGKSAAYASRINVREGHFSEMLSGHRPVALRHLIPLHEVPKAVQAFCTPLCTHARLAPPQPAGTLTAEQVAAFALQLMLENPALMRLLRDEGSVTFGVEPDEVLRAVGRGK